MGVVVGVAGLTSPPHADICREVRLAGVEIGLQGLARKKQGPDAHTNVVRSIRFSKRFEKLPAHRESVSIKAR